MMCRLGHPHSLYAWEEGPQTLTVYMVNNEGIYALGVASALLLVALYATVLAVEGWHLTFFTLVLVPVLCGVMLFTVLANVSPFEEWVIRRGHGDVTCDVSITTCLGTRITRLTGGRALRLALTHDSGSQAARTVLAVDDPRPLGACVAINLFLAGAFVGSSPDTFVVLDEEALAVLTQRGGHARLLTSGDAVHGARAELRETETRVEEGADSGSAPSCSSSSSSSAISTTSESLLRPAEREVVSPREGPSLNQSAGPAAGINSSLKVCIEQKDPSPPPPLESRPPQSSRPYVRL